MQCNMCACVCFMHACVCFRCMSEWKTLFAEEVRRACASRKKAAPRLIEQVWVLGRDSLL